MPGCAVNLLSTLGLAAVLGAAVWLGGIGKDVEQQSKKINDLTAIIRGIETRVGSLETKIAGIDERLKAIDDKLDSAIERRAEGSPQLRRSVEGNLLGGSKPIAGD